MPDALRGTRLLVFPEHDGLRLDQFLAAATALSRRAARRVISDGSVARNCCPTRVQGRVVESGDVIDVLPMQQDLGVPPRPALREIPILHHDGWLVAVDKPSGVLSQTGSRGEPELALDQLVLLLLALERGSRPYLRLVHRLDRLTSGVALFARNPEAHGPLTRAWSSGAVERRYTAIVEGFIEADDMIVDEPIERDPDHDWRFRVGAGGRPARTELRVVRHLDDGFSIVECRLLTGRTHQVRVHLSHLGHPVLGDRLYGSRATELADRPLLHAGSITLPHPKGGAVVTIESPLPRDLAAFTGPAT